MSTINNRHEITVLFEIVNGNPNGDPDAGNAPRVDPETGICLITNECLNAKIRKIIELIMPGKPGYQILMRSGASLNSKFRAAYEELGLEHGKEGKNRDDVTAAKDYMCRNYYDVRTFGAVMNTGSDRCGSVTGPFHLEMAQSISPVQVNNITLTRQCRTTDERRESGETEFGNKSVIPYALFRVNGWISAYDAQATGMTEEDLELLWTAITNMFEHDHSSTRGRMSLRKLYVFRHDSAFGNAHDWELFDKIKVTEKNPGVPPRCFADYDVTVDENMPNGVTLLEKL